MINQTDYQNILQFANRLIMDNLRQEGTADFIRNTLNRVSEYFGLDAVCMASLSNSGAKTVPSNFVTGQVGYAFIQKFLTIYRSSPGLLDLSSDLFWLGGRTDYKKGILYQEVLRPFGYSDMILQFIRSENSENYLSCMLYLTEKQPFKAETTELLEAIRQPLANAHLDNINTNRLLARIGRLSDTMDYFPVGILYISADHKILRTNEIARQYFADFGITDPCLYDTFFTDNIYTYYMRTVRSRNASLPLRVGNYLFSVSPITSIIDSSCPAYRIFDSELSRYEDRNLLLGSIDDAVACVYIIYSEQQQVQFSTAGLSTMGLTGREVETTEYVAKGMNNTEIAEAMNISENTVKTHLANIYKKLGINYRAELINLAHKI